MGSRGCLITHKGDVVKSFSFELLCSTSFKNHPDILNGPYFTSEYKSLKFCDFNLQLKPEQIGMKLSTSIFALLTVISVSSGMGFTALDIDNHPCKPENLKVYLCQLLA